MSFSSYGWAQHSYPTFSMWGLEQEINLNATLEQETACKMSRIQNVVHSTMQPLSSSRTNIHVEAKASWRGVVCFSHPKYTTNVSVESIKDAL